MVGSRQLADSGSRLRPEDRDVVGIEGAIPGDDDRVEAEGLGQDHPIERVAVMHRQLCGANGVVAENRNAVELLGLGACPWRV